MLETIICRSFGGIFIADQLLDLRHLLVGQLQPRSGRRLQVDGEHPGVGARKEGQADEGIKHAGSQTQQQCHGHHVLGIRSA